MRLLIVGMSRAGSGNIFSKLLSSVMTFFIIFLVLCFMMVNDEKQLILKIIFIGDIHKQITLCISFSRGVCGGNVIVVNILCPKRENVF